MQFRLVPLGPLVAVQIGFNPCIVYANHKCHFLTVDGLIIILFFQS